jgi:hypothetical protein
MLRVSGYGSDGGHYNNSRETPAKRYAGENTAAGEACPLRWCPEGVPSATLLTPGDRVAEVFGGASAGVGSEWAGRRVNKKVV